MKKKISKNSFLVMIALAITLAYFLSGGPTSHRYIPSKVNPVGVMITQTPVKSNETLQMNSIIIITATPLPTPTP